MIKILLHPINSIILFFQDDYSTFKVNNIYISMYEIVYLEIGGKPFLRKHQEAILIEALLIDSQISIPV